MNATVKNIPCTPPRRYADGLIRLNTSAYGDVFSLGS